MAILPIRVLLNFIVTSFVLVNVEGVPGTPRGDSQFSVVTTQYGRVRGRTSHVDDNMDLEIYLGVRYAAPPVGDLRLARPQPPTPWMDVVDALEHGTQCAQRNPSPVPELEGVPYGEDCLFLDIYMPRYKDNNIPSKVPTMMWVHDGGFYLGTGAKYNFTNVALKGVAVVSVNYRLDIFGFLSTQDDVIPGNFGLLDNIMALDWIRANIEAFGGDPEQITVFGESAGGAITSIMTLSPLSRGKFARAIMQSGTASSAWTVRAPGLIYAVPRDLARLLGTRVNCSLPQVDFSEDLLECLRAAPADVLLSESVYMQSSLYDGKMMFVPVVETAFGVIPDTPYNLLRRTDELVHIPTMYGYTREDGSVLAYSAKDGITLEDFKTSIQALVDASYPPNEHDGVYNKAISTYLPKDPSGLSKLDLRNRLIRAATGAFQVGSMIREARLFGKASTGDNSEMYLYEFSHRPSFSPLPAWMGVSHTDDLPFTLGLPVGPDQYKYPFQTADDEVVADFVTTTWTNFAKFGDPTPSPVQNVTWSQFKPGTDEQIMVIQPSPFVKNFDREEDVEVWASTPSIDETTTPALAGSLENRCQDEEEDWGLPTRQPPNIW